MYQALYRKWRPRTFDDVVGQEHITETLEAPGSDGTAVPRLPVHRHPGHREDHLRQDPGPGGELPASGEWQSRATQCPACQGIENGSILDVLELDAASNNGVDQVRALRDEAVYTPAAVRKRVYIVDEVHMLSTAAFNALLKILEEPPAHLMFILATTELHKVPATIKSRCQQFAFKRILPSGHCAGRLAYVAQEEGIALTAPAADLCWPGWPMGACGMASPCWTSAAARKGSSPRKWCCGGAGPHRQPAHGTTFGLRGPGGHHRRPDHPG